MSEILEEQITTLRAEVAMLARTVRTQGMAIDGLLSSLQRHAGTSAGLMRQMIVALHSASELGRGEGPRAN